MASFTTNVRDYQFNPYVNQLDTDAYLRVGLAKQQAYEQGVQRVQGAIDNIAGLDVIKPEQKDYLQQRVGQLTGAVSKVVGQDFSQSQLVNQVGALTNQIAKDPIIQSAVSSTARYRQESGRMEKAIQDGKSDPSNEYVFQKQFQDWISDRNVKSSFQGTYTPYRDVKKKILDTIKQLHPDSNLQDIPWKMNNGRVITNPDGTPEIDWAMVQRQTKSLTPEKIQSAIQGSLDEGDRNQLRINGLYEYRGLDKSGLKQAADNSYNYKLGQLNDILKGYSTQKLTNTTDIGYQQDLDNKIRDVENHRDSLINQYQNDIGFLDHNPEAYKGELYTQNWLSNLSNGFSYAENALTYKDNPYFKASQEIEKNKIDTARLQLEMQRRDIELEKWKWEKLMKEAEGKGLTGNGLGAPGITGPIDQDSLPSVSQAAWSTSTEQMQNVIDGEKMKLVSSLFPDLTRVTRNPKQASPLINYADPKSKQEAETALLKLKDDWAAGKTIPPAAKEYFESSANMENRLNNRNAAMGKVKQEADTQVFNADEFFKNTRGLLFTERDGSAIHVSPQDIAEFRKRLTNVVKPGEPVFTGPGMGVPAQTTLDDKEANKQFPTRKDQIMYSAFKKIFNGQPLNETDKIIGQKLGEVGKLVVKQQGKLTERDNYIDDRLKDLIQVQQPVSFPVAQKQTDRMQAIAGNLADNFARQKASELPGGSDLGLIGKMYKDKETKYSLESAGNNAFYLKLTNPAISEKAQRIPMTQDQVNTNFPGSTVNDFSAVKEALALTKNLDRATTDVQGNGPISAFILKNQNLNKYGVKYHVEEPYRDGRYQIRVYLQDKSSPTGAWKEFPVPLPSLVDDSGLAGFLANFGDDQINQMLSPK